jgi:dTDP-4-dehydrorhamnose reductase
MKIGGSLFSTIRYYQKRHGKRTGNLRLLITGASGLVGSRLTEVATSAGHDVFAIYYQNAISTPNAFHANLTDEQKISRIVKESAPEVVVHLASLTDVDLCERNPDLANLINAIATQTLARECYKAGTHLVYISTDYVFDGHRGNYTEEDQPNPVNTYGRSKLAGEEFTLLTSENFCVARTSVVYGWGRESRPNFGSWIYSELKAGRPVKVVDDRYSTPTLNTQLARMLLEVAERRLSGTIHLAGASRLSRYEFAREMALELHMDARLIRPTDSRSISWIAERPPDSSLNV